MKLTFNSEHQLIDDEADPDYIYGVVRIKKPTPMTKILWDPCLEHEIEALKRDIMNYVVQP